MEQGKTYNILLIEADPSLRRLISLGLQHQGMRVIEASSPATAPTLDAEHLHLLILDIDNGMKSDWSLLDAAQTHPHFATLPTIVLSWEQAVESRHQSTTSTMTHVVCQTKPFDARRLHATIDELLNAKEEKEAARVAKAEEVLLAAYTAQTPPSIWPVVTAIGLLLIFVGLLLQITITVLGILIVIVGLLWWTLGTKPKSLSGVGL